MIDDLVYDMVSIFSALTYRTDTRLKRLFGQLLVKIYCLVASLTGIVTFFLQPLCMVHVCCVSSYGDAFYAGVSGRQGLPLIASHALYLFVQCQTRTMSAHVSFS